MAVVKRVANGSCNVALAASENNLEGYIDSLQLKLTQILIML